MSRFGWMQRFRRPLWAVVRIGDNGWMTVLSTGTDEQGLRLAYNALVIANPTQAYGFLWHVDVRRNNKRVAMEQWSGPAPGEQQPLSWTVDATDRDGMVSIAQRVGAMCVEPKEGYPKDVVMVLNGMHIRHGDTIVYRQDNMTVIPADPFADAS